jgi:hypothetical protein
MANTPNKNIKGELNTGFNQLYNPIFCKQLNTNQEFIQLPSQTFDITEFNKSGKLIVNNKVPTENDCLINCYNDQYCTAYTFDNTAGSNTPNCALYRGNFPSKINPTTNTQYNSGYSLQFSYDYNKLSEDQKKNVRQKCTNQFLNTKLGNNYSMDLTSCLKFKPRNFDSMTVETNPECLYNIYNTPNVNTNLTDTQIESTFILNEENIKMNALTDPIIDKYKRIYDAYYQDVSIASNIKNIVVQAIPNTSNLFQDLQESANNITNQYISSVEGNMDNISSFLLSQIGNEPFSSNIDDESKKIIKESSNNNNNNIYNLNYNVLLIIIILIILILIIIITLYIKRNKKK